MGIYSFRWNVPAKYPISETIYGYDPVLKLDFLKIEFQYKTRFLENWVIAKLNLKIKIKLWNLSSIQGTQVHGTWVPLENFHGTRVYETRVL